MPQRRTCWARGARAAFLSGVAFALVACTDERGGLERALVGRGRVAIVGEVDRAQLHPSGTSFVPYAQSSALAKALGASDPSSLVHAMVDAGVDALLVDTHTKASPRSLADRLARYARLPGLQGAYFGRSAALYGLDPIRDWSSKLRDGLAEVARRLIGGAPPPRVSSFPDVVRRLEPVEVMVLLRDGTHPRLWRSARGSSFARALLTATAVARQRWVERSAALGGPLGKKLPTMSVELSLLQDDGEIGVRDAAFIDRVVLPVHGVGYERKGGWHYLLPEATRSGGRQPSRAYTQLFADDGLSEDSLDNPDLRLYRLAVQLIGISPPDKPGKEPDDGLSEVNTPAEVLEP